MEEAHPQKRLLLELFPGTGTVGEAFRAYGWDVISLGGNPKAYDDATTIIDALAVQEISGRTVDLVWASSPRTNCSGDGTKTRGMWELSATDELVLKALSIAGALDCHIFMENPWSDRLRSSGWLGHLHMHRIDYCKYGTPYRMRTSIWTDTAWQPARPLCNHDCPVSVGGRRHTARAQPGSIGQHFSQRQLIPGALCDEIAAWATLRKDERDSLSARGGGTHRRSRDQRGRYCGTEILPQTAHYKGLRATIALIPVGGEAAPTTAHPPAASGSFQQTA